MGDKWWNGILEEIKSKNGISKDKLTEDKQQRINQLNLSIATENWDEAQRNAKNIIIYDELIKLNQDIIEADVIRIAESMSPTLDAEFDPLVEANAGEAIKLAIQKYIPLLAGAKSRGRKSRKRKSRGRKSRKRKSRKRKSRGRKSRVRKSKRRNR
jgi:hypothetical protein